MPTGPFTYTKTPVATDRLDKEIRDSSISIALDGGSTVFGNQVTIAFKTSLGDDEKTTLDSLVNAHGGSPLVQAPQVVPVTVQSQSEPQPFAQPTYRTKRNATTDLVSIALNTNEVLDFVMAAERYVSGGCLHIENAELGDYVTAEVYDKDGVIPSPYRTAVCESWPTVGKYIEKEFIKVATPGRIQAGTISNHEIDTYPLNAKITAGLYLRVTYFAVNVGLTRRCGITYHLTKKL